MLKADKHEAGDKVSAKKIRILFVAQKGDYSDDEYCEICQNQRYGCHVSVVVGFWNPNCNVPNQ